jgi:hypothetical protein
MTLAGWSGERPSSKGAIPISLEMGNGFQWVRVFVRAR